VLGAHLCCNESGLDANILQKVVNETNHLGVSKKEHVHDGRVIVQRGGALSESRVKSLDRLLIISYCQVMAVICNIRGIFIFLYFRSPYVGTTRTEARYFLLTDNYY
jgi:hypothetical protein